MMTRMKKGSSTSLQTTKRWVDSRVAAQETAESWINSTLLEIASKGFTNAPLVIPSPLYPLPPGPFFPP